MADTFLGSGRRLPVLIVIGGSQDAGASGQATEGLARAARRLGVAVDAPGGGASAEDQAPSGSTPGDGPGPVPSGPTDETPVILLNLGEVTESHLHVLPPPSGTAADVLLWMLPSAPTISTRTLYVVACCAWSVAARHVRCLLPPRGSDPESARQRIVWGLERTGCAAAVEVLPRACGWGQPATDLLLEQILRSAICAGGGG